MLAQVVKKNSGKWKELCKNLSDEGWLGPEDYGRWVITNPLYGSIAKSQIDEVESTTFLKRLVDVLIEKKPSKALVRSYIAYDPWITLAK